jgi:hypothetical protein
MRRPYFHSKITELEVLFDRSRSDRAVLDALFEELNCRSVERAQRLKARVLQAIGTLEKNGAPREATFALPLPPTEPAPPPRGGNDLSSNGREPQTSVDPPVVVSLPAAPAQSRRSARAIPVTYANSPDDILSAWTALEVLSPFTFLKPADLVDGDDRRVARFAEQLFLPWTGGKEKARPNTQLFYHVVLGAVRMEEATSALLQVYVDDHADRRPARGSAGIATITLDKFGVPISENAVAISSFAWGLPLALRRDLRGLRGWTDEEKKLTDYVDRLIRRHDRGGDLLPLDLPTIDRVHEELVRRLQLPPDIVDAPGFALRHYHYWKASEPPDPPLLSSFFLGDLEAAKGAVSRGSHRNLKRYLGIERPTGSKDVLRDKQVLAKLVAPGRFPLGRWPSSGRYPLVLLQQAAVNAATSNDPENSLLPVNGPPGTGKTTLLRDLVAALVVSRAEAMCGFDDPETAFEFTGERRRSGAGFTHIYRPVDAIRGYEMLVASSNNKAVENVSRELPLLGAIASDAPDLHYFKTVSDNLSTDGETWGLVAAVLGNASNRYRFREGLWQDADRGLRSYLSEASGTPQFVEDIDPITGTVRGRRKPIVVVKERPPSSRAAALTEWRAARKAFQQLISNLRNTREQIETARGQVAGIEQLRTAEVRAEEARRSAEDELRVAEQQAAQAGQNAVAGHEALIRLQSVLAEHVLQAPGSFTRFFGMNSAREWEQRKKALEDDLSDARAQHNHLLALDRDVRAKLAIVRERVRSLRQAEETAKKAVFDVEQGLSVLRAQPVDRNVDMAISQKGHKELHSMPPWLSDDLHRQRDQVFEAALNVHRAFIGAAAKPVRNNLDALFRTFFGRAAWSPKMRPAMPALWSTLFLVVPVVSTTFASIERMIGFLPPESLGWLLIDEAGQALPQAAVGAIMRTKRAIVVGDPLQIEPVTTLPTQLAEAICDEFKVDPERWNAPVASVQTLADAASPVGASIPRDNGSIRVGLPLLVHRRCADPMFTLSNNIAYAGLMVKKTANRTSAIRDVLGTSHWIDVRPTRTEDKWSEAEGEAVIRLLKKLAAAQVPNLDCFIVTPFVICAQRLREKVTASGVLSAWTEKPWDWVRDRIGTVHTVQGREADSVIFVLGAALPAQAGARGWAGGAVNLLNVAATRAQENLYVIGSRALWSEAGYFRSLASVLPARQPAYLDDEA